MNKLAILGVAALMLLVAPSATAAQCTDSAADAIGPIYATQDGYFYAETNGAAGLQRGDSDLPYGEGWELDGWTGCTDPDQVIF